MKKLLLVILLAFLGCSAKDIRTDLGQAAESLLQQGQHISAVESKNFGDLLRIELTIQASEKPYDQFKIQRTAKLSGQTKGSLILLPSRNCSSSEYEFFDEGKSFNDSFVGYLAESGWEVWGYAPRTTFLPEGQCGLSADCSAAQTWGMDTYIQDINVITDLASVLHPGRKPFIGGLSLGTLLAYSAISSHPSAYRGLISWENAILSNEQAFQAGFLSICQHDEEFLAQGVVVDDGFGRVSRAVLSLFQTDPQAPSPLPFFPPGFTNRQAFIGFFSLPSPAVPIPNRGFIVQAGDPFVSQAFTYASEARAQKMIQTGNYYESMRLTRDFDCSFAGVETKFSKNLKAFTGPILLIKNGLGFGEYAEDSVRATSSTDVTRLSHPFFGHADDYVHVQHREVIEKPILDWLNAHAQ